MFYFILSCHFSEQRTICKRDRKEERRKNWATRLLRNLRARGLGVALVLLEKIGTKNRSRNTLFRRKRNAWPRKQLPRHFVRYILRQEKMSGNSGWIPDGGLFLDSYKTNKKLFPTEFLKINIQNNPNLKEETEEEKHRRLLIQEHEWIYGPLDRTNSGDRTNQTTTNEDFDE